MRRTAVILALATTLSGCADPYSRSTTTPPVAGQEPGSPGRIQALHGSATPTAAVREAVALTGTFSAADRAVRLLRFARGAVGAARDEALLSAAHPLAGVKRSRTRIATITTVRAARGRRVVAVLAQEQSANARTTRHAWRVISATIVGSRAGWVVSRWEPQP